MANAVQNRRDTSGNWTSVNPIPYSGQICIETDTGKQKVGDGVTAWTALPYSASGGGGGVSDHPSLTSRNVPDQHTTAAITGLDTDQAAQDTATALVQTNLDDHEADTGNPHAVTYAQLPDAPGVFDGTADGLVPDPGTPLGLVLSDDGTWVSNGGGGGSGDVTGPASSVDDNLTAFTGSTGKVIKDSGIAATSVMQVEVSVLTDLANVDVPAPDNLQQLVYNADTAQWEARTSVSALGIIEFGYRWDSAAPPSSGHISSDNADPTLVTEIYVDDTTQGGLDISLFLESLKAGDWLNINAPGDYSIHNAYDITGVATKSGSVYTIPVTLYDSTPYLPGNNNNISLFLRFGQGQVIEKGALITGDGTQAVILPAAPQNGYVLSSQSTTLEGLEWVPVPQPPASNLNFKYKFSTSTSGDPGVGFAGVNNADPSLVTEININNITTQGVNVSAWLTALQEGERVGTWESGSNNEWVYYQVTGAPVNNTTYYTVPVIWSVGTGTLENGNAIELLLLGAPTEKIPSGGSTGQVLSKTSATDYDTEWVDQTGGGGGSSLPEFFINMIGDKILIVQTGQSNPYGQESTGGDDFPLNPRVWDLESKLPYVAGPQAQDFTDFEWKNPDPSLPVVEDATFPFPYIGYLRGGTGNQGMAMAGRIQEATNMDVYIFSACAPAAGIIQWQASGLVKSSLDKFVPWILSGLSGVDFQGKPGPDIITWGQSETNADPIWNSGADYMLPSVYQSAWQGVYEDANDTTDGKNWAAEGYSSWFLTEATQYVNWTGPPLPAGGAGYPWRWEGLNRVARYNNQRVKLVGSVGIPYGDGATGPNGPISGAPCTHIHYTGIGNNAYGYELSDCILGSVPANSQPNQELNRELEPKLNARLNCNMYGLEDAQLVSIDLGPDPVSGPQISGGTSQYIGMFSSNKDITWAVPAPIAGVAMGPVVAFRGTQTLLGNTGPLGLGQLFVSTPTVNLTSPGTGVASVSALGTLISNPTYNMSNPGFAVNMALSGDIFLAPTFNLPAGTVGTVAGYNAFATSLTLGANVSITERKGFIYSPAGGAGSVTGEIGFAAGISNATSRGVQYLLGATAVATIPAGTWGLYQANADESPHSLNGTLTLRKLAGTGIRAIGVNNDGDIVLM